MWHWKDIPRCKDCKRSDSERYIGGIQDLIVSARRQKSHWNKILRSDLIVLDELFYLKPSEENLQLLYRTVMFLSETRSFIFVTNRSLSEWDSMGVDKHTVSTFRQRILMDAQLIHLG